jgi:hypothetical protein
VALIAEVVEVWIRETRERASTIDLRDRHELIGIRIGERPKQNGVHDAENRGGRTDAERERENRHEREARLANEQSKCVAQVPKKAIHAPLDEAAPARVVARRTYDRAVKPFALALVLLTGAVVSAQSPELYSDLLFAIPGDYVETEPSESLPRPLRAHYLEIKHSY